MICPKCRKEVGSILSNKRDPQGGCVECVTSNVASKTPAAIMRRLAERSA